jgi:UDP-N-acetylmuramyl pentapeptide phosphotransferase/UDP-N-acetylglucosamine-1-phosphate transferase
MSENLCLFISFSISFAVVYFAVPKIITVSKAKKLFDVPTKRSANKEKIIPNLGGIAIFAGIYVSTIICLKGLDATKIIGLLLVTVIMFLMGLKDDLIGLSAGKKLMGQICVALYLIIACNIRLTNLHGILGINEINYGLSLFITLVAIIGLINAFNLIDGIDGLAAGIGTLISSAYGFLFLYFGQMEYAIVSFSITGALVSFFFFNVFGKDNKIFMGDTGSLTLGVLFAVLTIWFNEIIPSQGNHLEWTLPAISLAIMIVPVVDTLRIIYIRIFQGKSLFTTYMNHIHHQLIKLNNNHLRASIIMVLANLLLICLSFGLVNYMGNMVLSFLILAIGFSLASLPFLIRKYKGRVMKSVHVHTYQEGIHRHLAKSGKNKTTPEHSVNEQKMLTNEDLSKNGQSSWGKIQNSKN